MTNMFVIVFIIWALNPLVAAQSGPKLSLARGSARNRVARYTACHEDLEYRHGNICCLNCPAGTHVESACERAGEKGKCKACDYDGYTGHSNGLKQCLKCTKCRSDQDFLRSCTATNDTECQCRSGRFCAPDQACEVCKKCLSCKEDEEEAEKCTPISNTVCRKKRQEGTHPGLVALYIIIGILAIVIAGIMIAVYWRKRKRTMTGGGPVNTNGTLEVIVERHSEQDQAQDDPQRLLLPPVHLVQAVKVSGSEDEEDKGLGDSLPRTPSSSRHSLSVQPPVQSTQEPEPLPRLVPLNGDESLRKCIEYFEEIDVDYHKRFFRSIGLRDNDIKSKDAMSHEDRIHDLLNMWMEKMGRDADLNDLLSVLLDLNQRLTAERIIENAVSNGHYENEI